MPSFQDLIARTMTEEQLWHVAQYVRSLAPEEPPRQRGRARRADRGRAAGHGRRLRAGDRRAVLRPASGQVIVEPRWFTPTVDGIVQALHNGRELTLRLVWHDPSESPDRSGTSGRPECSRSRWSREPAPAPDDTTSTADTTAVPAASPSAANPDAWSSFRARSRGHGATLFPDGRRSRSRVSLAMGGRTEADELLARGLARYEPLSGIQPGS